MAPIAMMLILRSIGGLGSSSTRRVALSRIVVGALRVVCHVECFARDLVRPVLPDYLVIPIGAVGLLHLVNLVQTTGLFELERRHEVVHPLETLSALALGHRVYNNT